MLNTKESMLWIVVLGKTLESPLGSKEITPVNPKGNQPWIFIERADAEALIFCSPDAKSWLIGKDPEAGTDGRQEGRGQWRMRWLDGNTNSMEISFSKLQKIIKAKDAWHAAIHRVTENQTTRDWPTTTTSPIAYWTPSNLGSSSSIVISFCLFKLFMGFLGKNTDVVAIPSSSGQYFVINLCCDLPICLGWACPAWFIASLHYTSPFAMTNLW